MKNILFSAAFFISAALSAQKVEAPEKAPENWFNLKYPEGGVHGIGTERTYTDLLQGKKADTIIVAVIDGGIDYMHEDLKDVMWKNPREIANNGVDDDKNGYVDDIYGWNFIGGKDGSHVQYDQLELVRIYKPLHEKFKDRDAASIAVTDKKEYERYLELKAEYDKQKNEMTKLLAQVKTFQQIIGDMKTKIKTQRKVDSVMYEDFKNYIPDPNDKTEKRVHMLLKLQVKSQESWVALQKELAGAMEQIEPMIKYNLNLDYDPRSIVGDDYSNVNERYYGNNDVKGPEPLHGTHVAGIIAASRGNGVGIKGVASAVKIMALRAVPNGDERDKDVANSIRYAVDNGAKIINMSFGKSYGTHKGAVDEAVKYAESKGVLLVHAAGNDNTNIDENDNFPNPFYLNGGQATNWIEVGALSWQGGKYLPARFSNYGKKKVDVFAPGVDILSCKPDGGYIPESGTSMAAPVTSGAAAVLKTYFPSLTPQQLKALIEEGADKSMAKKKVVYPGKKKKKTQFRNLSRTGGMVDVYEAVKKAQAR